ncbi:hypothetical protein ONE63_000112 [Megalurothrips usitatus]|uniref:Peptidase S1 domain-containing protein n=1 Tax=Megalurothrips usitatus TaxID=439358 RepID=A0AAV7XYH7_9NEOP|nr:hypothetical protein ONE63_000112 [Megalurothrips usitatus]
MPTTRSLAVSTKPHLLPTERRFASTAPQCGWAPKSPAALTVHGDKVPLGAFPWHGGLYRKSGRGAYDYVCGANLITPSVLVTAAHCLYVRDKLQPAGKFAVALGKLYSAWDREDGSGVIKSDVQRVIPHPLYRGVARKYSADIALLQLSRPAELGDTIFPICLGNSHDKAGKVQVVGWGDDQAALEELQSVSLSVRDFGDCVGSFSGSAHELPFITEDKLCSSRDKGLERPPGLAKGDSGSGAVQPFHGQWHLMGLVSVSLDNGKFYGFTDVRRYWGWIHQTYRDITPEFNGTLLI